MRKLGRPPFIGCSLVVSALLSIQAPALAQTTLAPAETTQSQASSTSTTTVGPPAPGFSHLFQDTVGDFRRLPSRDTLRWIGIGAAAALISHVEDARITSSLSGSRGLDGTFEAGQTIGGVRFQLGGALAAYTFGRLTGSPRVTNIGIDLIQAQVLTQAMTAGVKFSARRTRPDGYAFSFPSGHASVTFASATVLQRHFGWKVGIPAYGVASYVAASRIQTRRHYLSDVAFGAALGIVAGRTVTIGHGNTRFAVSPMTAPGGGGVAFTWVGAQ